MNATLAAPRVSPSGPTKTGRPSASTVGEAPGTMRRMRPLLLMTGGVPGGGGAVGAPGEAAWVGQVARDDVDVGWRRRWGGLRRHGRRDEYGQAAHKCTGK